jgi:hypothetical protein
MDIKTKGNSAACVQRAALIHADTNALRQTITNTDMVLRDGLDRQKQYYPPLDPPRNNFISNISIIQSPVFPNKKTGAVLLGLRSNQHGAHAWRYKFRPVL